MLLRCPIMVGREPELDRLRRCAAANTVVVAIAGEPGVGRTRLAEAMLELPDFAGHHRLVGRCHPRRAPARLGVLSDALSQVGWPTGPAEPSEAALMDRLVELLGSLGPTALVLEDLQWCDPLSLRLVSRLVACQPPNTAVVMSRRSGADGSPLLARMVARASSTSAVECLTLAPLDELAVGEMAGALGTGQESAEFAAALRAATGGLPRVIAVVMKRLSRAPGLGALAGDRGTEALRALGSVVAADPLSDHVLGAAAGLDGATRRIIDAASVLGASHEAAVLAAVAGMAPRAALRAAGAAVAEGLLVASGSRYGFRSPLAAEAVAATIPRPERQGWHRRAARVLSQQRPRPWAELARHHRGCGEVAEWARCVDAATSSPSNPAAAVALLRDVVLEPGLTPARRARLASRLGSAAERAGIPGGARMALQKVVEEHPLPSVLRADVRWFLGYLHLAVGDADGWRDQRVAAVDDLRRRPDLAALVMMELAMPWVEHGRIDEHRRWLDQAVAAAASQRDPVVTLCVGVATALVPLYTGDPAGWVAMEAIPWDASSPEERLQLLWAAQNLGGACFHLGHYDLARRLYDRGAGLAAEMRRSEFAHVFRAADLSLAWATGRWDGLEAIASEYIQEFAEMPGWTLHGKMVVGHLLLHRGELDQAERLLREAAAAAQVAGAIPSVAVASGGLARVSLARGEPDRALTEAGEAFDLLSRKGIWSWVCPVAPPAIEAMTAAGRLPEAADLVSRFAQGLRGRDAPLARAALRHCQGMVAAARSDHAGAASALGQAARSYRALPRPFEAAEAVALRGISLMELGDPTGPRSLHAALAAFQSLGASASAARARQALRSRSVIVPQPWRGGRRGYGTRVSPRQREVVALAATGRTNEEIARQLYISEKTVEDHLRAAMEKLGVASKRDLRRGAAPG